MRLFPGNSRSGRYLRPQRSSAIASARMALFLHDGRYSSLTGACACARFFVSRRRHIYRTRPSRNTLRALSRHALLCTLLPTTQTPRPVPCSHLSAPTLATPATDTPWRFSEGRHLFDPKTSSVCQFPQTNLWKRPALHMPYLHREPHPVGQTSKPPTTSDVIGGWTADSTGKCLFLSLKV